MSYKAEYDKKIGEIAAISEEDIQIPYMPIVNYTQEVEELCKQSLKDLDKLAESGLKEEYIRDTQERLAACREAHRVWRDKLEATEDDMALWREKSKEAYKLRRYLVHIFTFAFRKHGPLTQRMEEIADSFSHPDLIQDLNHLAHLGKTYWNFLEGFDLDKNLLEEAAKYSVQMNELLAKANGGASEYPEAKIIRDKAYTHLKEAVDEIRQCAKFVFWKDQDKLALYRSKYPCRNNTKNNISDY